jgi:aminoglycoside phosphotransferase (APT) family kinase protein
MSIPSKPDEICPRWLTEVLRASGVCQGNVVSAQSTMLQGGNVSQVARVELAYDDDAPSAPRSLIAKLGPNDEAFGEQFSQRESLFFQRLAADIPTPTPMCYHAEVSTEQKRVILLLEDLGSTRQMTWEEGLTVDQARGAAVELARLHAASWDDQRLAQMDWLMRRDLSTWNEQFADRWRQLDTQARDTLADPIVRICVHMASQGTNAFARWWEAPQTLLHGDYHLHNLLFEADHENGLRAVIDWSNVGVGPGACDLSFFLTHSLQSRSRRLHERELVQLYHDTLMMHGVTGYDDETCWDDYRLWNLNYGLLWATIPAQGRSHIPFWGLLVDRLSEAVVDSQAELEAQ